ncbi:MAG: sigma-70 family RNA polymerase sigma factor [Acidobacteriia bacterium]|nr:sigma-70 family RNA polymerase sigma factor [Terriglobia bacterium]
MAIEGASDGELVHRAGKGDVAAFNVLVRKWEKPLYNFALRLTGHRDDALDLAQDAFLKAYNQLHQLQGADKFSRWLFKIALNLFYSAKRGSHEGQTISLDEEVGNGLNLLDALPPGSLKNPAGSDALVFERERARGVRRAIAQLVPDQRAAIILKIYYGMKFEEIAEVVDCPVSTVKSRLYAAMEILQETLKDWTE